MATLPNSKLVTYEEWLRLPEVTDSIEEVIDGEVRIMPAPTFRHLRVVKALDVRLTRQLENRRVIVAASSFDLIIRKAPLTARMPDIAVFDEDTLVEQDGCIHSAPQLVVEVLSPSNTRREQRERFADYAYIGVPEVWAVSIEARTVEVLLLKDGRLQTDRVLPESGVLIPSRFPDVQIELASIWPD